MKTNAIASVILILVVAGVLLGQTTAFVYQGNLVFSGQPANGNFDFEFALFDDAAAGNQLGTTQAVNNVGVSNGVFSVSLDFGSQFPGASRFLEIRVRQAGQPGITILSPRQPISSTPYAVKSISADTAANATNATTAATATNALSLGGVAANQYVLTGDARLSDARPPTAGSANYIQNSATQQLSSNFNISGSGNANVLNAASQYQLNGLRLISSPNATSVFLGFNNAPNNTGASNSFFGSNAGALNTTGQSNSFFGSSAGSNNQGSGNSFFGTDSGLSNSIGYDNAYFGKDAGRNTNGAENTFLGASSGINNTSGSSNNTMIGFLATGFGSNDNATAIGSRAAVSTSNSLVLGSIQGTNGATASTNVGIGTTAPSERLHVVGNALFTGNLAVNGNITGNLPTGSSNYIQNTTTQQSSSNFNISGNGTVGGTLSAGTLNATSQINVGGGQAIKRLNSTTLEIGDANDGIDVAGSSSRFGMGSSSGYTDIGGYFNGIYGFGGSPSGNEYFPQLVGRFGRGTVQAPGSPLMNDVLFSVRGGGRSGNGWSFNDAKISFVATENWTTNAWGSRIDFETVIPGTTTSSRTLSITNTGLGIRTTDPSDLLDIATNGGNIRFGSAGCTANTTVAIGLNGPFGNCLNYTLRGTASDVYLNRPTGGAIVVREGNGSTQFAINAGGTVDVRVLGTTGGTALCRNADQEIAFCSSSLRYKKNVVPFAPGLSFVRQLRPIAYEWKTDGNKDVGFGAEDVAKIDPRFVTYNDKGEVEGIKYDRLSVAFVNAFREQQERIEDLNKTVREQQARIEQLSRLVCEIRPDAEICRPK